MNTAVKFLNKHKIFIIAFSIILLINYVASEVLWYMGYFGVGGATTVAYIALDISFKILFALFVITLGVFFLNFMKTKQ